MNDSRWVTRTNDGRVAVYDMQTRETSKFATDEGVLEIGRRLATNCGLPSLGRPPATGGRVPHQHNA